MKIGISGLVFLLMGGLAACSQVKPMPRDELALRLAPIVTVEQRADRVKYYTHILRVMGGMSNENLTKLKAHYDIYYVYYLAAHFHLAKGETDSYMTNVNLAEGEVHAMESILQDKLAELPEDRPNRQGRLSGSGL